MHASSLTPSPAPRPIRELIEEGLHRRSFLHVTISGTCAALLAGAGRGAAVGELAPGTPLFQFRNVPPSQSDTVVVPEGYVAEVLYRWGDPINGSQPTFRPDASNSADEQMLQAGMGHDGMEFFSIPGHDANARGLLAINHEYSDQILLYADGLKPMPPTLMPLEKVRKSQAAHGVSIVEIARQSDGRWAVVDSPRARRITASTLMRLSGPATSVLGESVRGTVNNCAAGRTPWGTYLTCEENFQGVFGSQDENFSASPDLQRYGLRREGYS